MKPSLMAQVGRISNSLDIVILATSLLGLVLTALGMSTALLSVDPLISPFTLLSLILMTASRWADRNIETWSKPMTMAMLGITAGGNLSSLLIQLMVPALYQQALPDLVPTSSLTATGILILCSYEMLVLLRKTPERTFIFDDILLHLALIPGSLSLMGHFLSLPIYTMSASDPRVGIGLWEILLMGAFTTGAAISNPDLFLWRFLASGWKNVMVFLVLVANQFLAPLMVYLILNPESQGGGLIGLELFVMFAGIIATLSFLIYQARQGLGEATVTVQQRSQA